jgi:nucleoside phosphorylase
MQTTFAVTDENPALHRRAVILTALPIERTAVSEHLRDVREEVHRNGSIYRRGTFDENSEPWDILLAEIGPGNEAAAAEAERAIAHFSPDVAVFIGIAGAIKDLAHGDVVASTKVYNYGSGKDKTSHFETRPDTELPAYSLRERARYEAGEMNWLQRIRAEEQTVALTAKPSAKVGPIAAGPKILASTRSATYNFVRENYGDALAVEMEGHGFLLGVRMNHPVQGIVVRGISDCIGDKTPDNDHNWQPVAARRAAAFAFQILSKLPRAEGKTSGLSPSDTKLGVFMDVSVLDEDTSSWGREEDSILRYSLRPNDHGIRIEAKLGHFSIFKAGGPIGPINYFTPTWCAFWWDFPILDFKIVNNGPTTLFFSEVTSDIEESRPDRTPFFTIKEDTQQAHAGDLLLINEGWCDLTDVVISFHLFPGKVAVPSRHVSPYAHTVTLSLLADRAEINVTKAFQDEGADINGLLSLTNGEWESQDIFVAPNLNGAQERIVAAEYHRRIRMCLGPFRDWVGTLAGEISFASADDASHHYQVKFQAVVYLGNENRKGIPMPPTYTYATIFDAQKTAYQRLAKISHAIKPGEADRFTVKIAVPRSSSHRFRATIRDIGGLVLKSLPIEMNCFVPRYRRDAVAKAISSARLS